VIVQAAMTMLVLIGLSAFVVDHGVLWLSREQAQNAADAGAIAGAIARAYDNLEESPSASAGVVFESVQQTVAANPVWFDGNPPTFAVSYACPPNADRCVKVDVHRDGTLGSATLPVFFGPVLGITSQRVQATATAQVAVGNGTTCLKPWAIPDKWIEGSVPADNNFKKHAAGPNADDYRPPTANPPGGYAFPDDLGQLLTLSFAHPEANEPITAGFLLPLVLPGANTYEQNITGCNNQLATFDQTIAVGTSAEEPATNVGFQTLFDSDPAASWVNNNVNGCAPVCAPISPRLVALAVFDVEQYEFMRAVNWAGCGPITGPGGQCVKVVNIVGFFIQGVAGGVITGRLARYPGRVWADSPTLTSLSSFLPAITLVR
jgi:Flp pilus assembly protein TadG